MGQSRAEAPQFLAALSLPYPVDCSNLGQGFRAWLKAVDNGRYKVKPLESTLESAQFELTLTEDYKKERIKEVTRGVAPEDLRDPEERDALGRYDLTFLAVVTSAGLLRVEMEYPKSWSTGTAEIATHQLYFLLFHFAKDLLQFILSREDEHEVADIRLQKWFCAISSKPELRMRRKVGRVLTGMMEDTRVTHEETLGRLHELLDTRLKRTVFPWRTLFSDEIVDMAAYLHREQADLRMGIADLHAADLSLREIGIDVHSLATRHRTIHRLEDYAAADDFLLSRVDSIGTSVGAWLAVVGLGVAMALFLISQPVSGVVSALALITVALLVVGALVFNTRHSEVFLAFLDGLAVDGEL